MNHCTVDQLAVKIRRTENKNRNFLERVILTLDLGNTKFEKIENLKTDRICCWATSCRSPTDWHLRITVEQHIYGAYGLRLKYPQLPFIILDDIEKIRSHFEYWHGLLMYIPIEFFYVTNKDN